MKRFSHTLVSVVVILLVFAIGPVASVSASSIRPALTVNPLAEEYVRNELLIDGDVDLKDQFPNASDRVISADFIVSLWNDPAFQEIAFFKIRNASITGNIEAEGVDIPFIVQFWSCNFDGRINLSNAHFKAFNMYDSHVQGAVRMGRLVVDGDLALYQSIYEGEVTLFGADIGQNLFAKGSEFKGVVPDQDSAYPFELWTTHVGQTTEFTGSSFFGEAKVDSAKFDGDLKFDQTTFEKPAYFANIQVGNVANFQKATFKDSVTFESSIMDRDVQFTGATFNGPANFDYIAVERFFDFNETTFNQSFSIKYPVIGWPFFEKAVFNGPVNFEGMQASNDFDFTGAAYNYSEEPFTVTLATVAGAVRFTDFTAPAGLSLDHNQFGDLIISAKDKPQLRFVMLDATRIDGSLTVENLDTFKFTAASIKVEDATTFRQMSVTNELDMSNASLGFFTIDKAFWPEYPDSFNLRGTTYTDIGLYNQELNDNTWSVLLDMVNQSSYSPQAYRTLAEFLTEKGHPDWAAEVDLSQKRRERDSILTPRSGPWFWSWFLDIFSGYGQRPDFAFIWSALVIVTGALVFRREEDMVILDDTEAKPIYNPLLYSFALFLPYIDLGIASKWDPKPNRKFASVYKHVHRLMGWVLMPIALLTFGGVI